MSGKFVRSSKYRHVFGTPFKREKCYDNIKITKSPHDSNMCSVNGKFLAVVLEAQGGGAFLVCPLTKPGRFDINYPKVCGHKGLVMDIAWNPFNDNEIASSSEDCKIMIWEIPDGGISENLSKPIQTLEGHQRKVGHIAWHPSASNVLLSASFDNLLIVWNTVEATQLYDIEVHPDIIYSISWNYNGSLIATTCKDKKIRVIDPRKGEVISEGQGHLGTKPSRVVFCGSTNRLFSTGFTRNSERQYAVWDPSKLDKALQTENIDTGSGVLFPFWDEGTNMVYIVGKGDTQIKYFEIVPEKPYCHYLSMFMSTVPQRGAGVLPKREVDYMHCEVMRFYKLSTPRSGGIAEPISMTVPRKSEMFQDDIYPPCFSGSPAMTADEWVAGGNKEPLLLAFSRDGLQDTCAAEGKMKPVTFTKAPEPKQESTRSSSVSKGIASRTAQLQRQASGSNKEVSPPPPAPSRGEPQNLEEYRKAYKELVAENEMLRKKLAELQH